MVGRVPGRNKGIGSSGGSYSGGVHGSSGGGPGCGFGETSVGALGGLAEVVQGLADDGAEGG